MVVEAPLRVGMGFLAEAAPVSHVIVESPAVMRSPKYFLLQTCMTTLKKHVSSQALALRAGACGARHPIPSRGTRTCEGDDRVEGSHQDSSFPLAEQKQKERRCLP